MPIETRAGAASQFTLAECGVQVLPYYGVNSGKLTLVNSISMTLPGVDDSGMTTMLSPTAVVLRPPVLRGRLGVLGDGRGKVMGAGAVWTQDEIQRFGLSGLERSLE